MWDSGESEELKGSGGVGGLGLGDLHKPRDFGGVALHMHLVYGLGFRVQGLGSLRVQGH